MKVYNRVLNKEILLNKNLIWLLIADIIIASVSLTLAIYLYNISNIDSLITWQILTDASEKVINSIIVYVVLLYFFRIYVLIRSGNFFLTKWQILTIATLYGILSVLYFYLTVPHLIRVTIIFLLYFIFLFTFIFLWQKIVREVYSWFNLQKNIINNKESALRKFVPPIILEKMLRIDTSFFKERPAICFIIGFILLFFFHPVLIVLKHKWLARQFSNLSYLLLVIAIGVELYQQIKRHND